MRLAAGPVPQLESAAVDVDPVEGWWGRVAGGGDETAEWERPIQTRKLNVSGGGLLGANGFGGECFEGWCWVGC
jgi:hypothetical protein